MTRPSSRQSLPSVTAQGGITTLTITILLLAIVTVVGLFATNVAFFEQRTANNENRSRLAEQAAEYGANIGGEYLKSKLSLIVSKGTGGWLATSGAKWTACNTVTPTGDHPCLAITSNADGGQRDAAYFATLADDTDGSTANDLSTIMADGGMTSTGGTAAFPVKLKIDAVLCRLDNSNPANQQCKLTPTTGNALAVTLISRAIMEGESSAATVKETWSSYSAPVFGGTVPLIASGVVNGLGNAQIVASPNAGGYGIPASVWSPVNVDIEDSTSGSVGSVSTCHLGGYLGHGAITVDNLLTTCSGSGNTGCGCPGKGDPDFLSGHVTSLKTEGKDILDVDNAAGDNDLPDITFFPGAGKDKATDNADDNLFEYIFGVSYVSEFDASGTPCNEDNAAGCSEDTGTGNTDTDCGTAGTTDCAVYAMQNDLGFNFITCTQLDTLGAAANGLYYITDSATQSGDGCNLPGQIGSPTANAVVVLDQKAKMNSTKVFGMLFVRSPTNSASLKGTGNSQVFGSTVVEGTVDLAGGIDLIYYDWAGKANEPKTPPALTSFGRVSGSWLDDDEAF